MKKNIILIVGIILFLTLLFFLGDKSTDELYKIFWLLPKIFTFLMLLKKNFVQSVRYLKTIFLVFRNVKHSKYKVIFKKIFRLTHFKIK